MNGNIRTGKCKHEDEEGGCKIGVLKFFNMLVCDYSWKQDCEDYEEQESK